MPRLLRLLAVSLAVSLLHLTMPALSMAADKPPYTLEERAEAISRPALVFIETRVEGYLRYKETGELVSNEIIVVNQRCSGFLVSSAGHVLTAAHCVKPTAWRDYAAAVLADLFVERKVIAENQRDSQIGYFVSAAVYVGSTPESQPTVKIMAQQNALREGEAATPAEVVSANNEADVALVKLSVGGLPMAEIGAAGTVDEQIVLIGYSVLAGTDNERRFAPRSKLAHISGLPSHPAAPSTLDSDLGGFSDGGMVVDRNGLVVGMIKIDTQAEREKKPSRLMIHSAALKSVLDGAGVSNAAGSSDQAYRAGLDAYFAGKYSEAIKRFDDVLRAVPDHQLAADYRKRAEERLTIEGDAGLDDATLYVLLGAAGAIVLVAVVGIPLIVISRRKRRKALAAAWQMSASPYPVSGIPISVVPLGVDGTNPAVQNEQFHFRTEGSDPNTGYYGQPTQSGPTGANPWAPPPGEGQPR